MGTRKHINLSAEVRDAQAKVIAGLERSSLFALVGERLGKLPPDLELPSGNTTVRFGGPKPIEGVPPTDLVWSEMKEEFAEYCARYAVVGMITTCEVYLQRLLFIARLAQEVSKCSGNLTGETFHAIRNRCQKEARYSRPDKLATKALETVGCDISAVTGLHWFSSIYNLRICLLHRGGTIGQDDVDDNGILTAVWRRIALSVDGKDISAFPFRMEKGETLAAQFVDEVRTWRAGEKLRLTAQDCQDIGLSLAFFAGQIADELQKGLAAMLGSGSEIK